MKYKVGDKVMTISSVNSDYYDMVEDYGDYCWTDEMIEGLAGEENKSNIIEEAKTYWDSIKDAWICPEGYVFKDENGNVINATKIVLEKKKKKYPKTYEECCKVLDWNHRDYDRVGYESELLCKFQVLLLCRDAYRKVAGEEMGLEKPWKPYFKNGNQTKYCIYNDSGDIIKGSYFFTNGILAFPTEEMRDAFYENFKGLIEQCKELL